MPGLKTPYAIATRRQMRAEVADLRHTLEMDGVLTFEQWQATLPQQVRDGLAARALIDAQGNLYTAAARLGFKGWGKRGGPDVKALLERIFNTPGVQAILERDLSQPEANRAAMLARQIEIALYGDNRESSIAFAALSRVCGWQKSPDVLVQHNRATILTLVTQKNMSGETPTIEAIQQGFLEHEPGPAIRIDSGSELVDAALADE